MYEQYYHSLGYVNNWWFRQWLRMIPFIRFGSPNYTMKLALT